MKLKLRAKFILFISAILLFFGIVLFIVNQNNLIKSLKDEKRIQTQELVRVGMDVLDHFYKLEIAGEMSRVEAQKNASDVIRGMLFGEQKLDYYFINLSFSNGNYNNFFCDSHFFTSAKGSFRFRQSEPFGNSRTRPGYNFKFSC